MAASRGKGKGQRIPASGRQRVRSAEEVVLSEYGDVESTSKQSYLALQQAFNDITKKYCKLQEEKAALSQENEFLKEKLEKGFEAFDDKFKETEKLKKELDFKEKNNVHKDTGSNNDQHTCITNKTEEATAMSCHLDTHIVEQEIQVTSESTQTDEEKTDDVAMSPVNFKDLLESCGFEIVVQDDKVFLILINRDNFIRWLENETDGKISVDFEKTPVCERFIQTDEVGTSEQQLCNHEALIIQLKGKITDQASKIMKQRQILVEMQQHESTAPVQAENIETVKNQRQALTRYHQTFLSRSREVENQTNILKKQLQFQQQYTKHLVDVIQGSKDVPKQFKLLSEVTQGKLKSSSQGQREIKKPPTFPVAEHAEGNIEEKPIEDEPLGDDPGGLFSIAVQETEDESLASVVTISESRSSTSNKSGLPFSQAKDVAPSSNVVKNPRKKTRTTSFGDDEEQTKLIPVGQTSADEEPEVTGSDYDDIVVINEEDIAIGGASGIVTGAKQCPVCYISFSPSSSQDEFEKHVLAHFQD